MQKIVVIGSSNVDTTLHVANFPKPGETINAKKVTTAGGGKGANQAIAAAKSGAETYFISRIGEDADGEFMLRQLRACGVNTEYVQTTPRTNTGHAYINLDASGQNNIVLDHGANYSLTEADVTAAQDVIVAADVVLAQFEIPLAVTLAAFKIAKAAGKVTMLNPAPAERKIPAELLAVADFITPNETEVAAITGVEISDEASLAKSCQALQESGVANVLITNGARGSYFSVQGQQAFVPAFKVAVVDTTCAGDTFLGYLAGHLDADFGNIKEAAIIASRAASIAVQRSGAQPSIPMAQEVAEAMGAKL